MSLLPIKKQRPMEFFSTTNYFLPLLTSFLMAVPITFLWAIIRMAKQWAPHITFSIASLLIMQARTCYLILKDLISAALLFFTEVLVRSLNTTLQSELT